jgi:hypothetical protein
MSNRLTQAGIACGLIIIASTLLVSTDRLHGRGDGQQPASQATGLSLTAEVPLGIPPAGPLYWHIYEYPTRASADAGRGARGTVAEVFGRHWLYTIADDQWQPGGGARIAAIGPLQVATNAPYTARYMEALFPPSGPEPYGNGHRHSGPEAWYVVSGAQCLETPNGLIMASAGGSGMVPEGWPMAISSAGPETRRALVLILHRSTEPFSMALSDPRGHDAPHSHWKPQGLCAQWRRD